MSLSVAIIITVVAILFSGLFSGTEIAFMQSSQVKTRIDAAKGGAVNRIIQGFSGNADMFISTILVGNNVVLVIYGISFSAILNPIFSRWFSNEALMLVCNTLLSTLLILFLGEFMPKTTFRINPNFMMRLLAVPLYLIYLVLYPVSRLVSWISDGLMSLFGISRDHSSQGLLTIDQIDDYIQHSIEARKDEKAIVENEVKIFRNAIDFKDTRIRECMIPRNEIVAVEIGHTTRDSLVKKFMYTGLSKIVVFRDDLDDVVGYIHVSELFDQSVDWTSRIKPVIFTPESMLANKMMRRLMAEKKSMAIVVDEFGGTAGLATLEDLVEEIFGEIEDEHDKKRVIGRKLADGSFEFSGRAEIEHINEQFGLSLPESDEYHTLAGYIIEHLETLPKQGSSFEIDGYRFDILRRSANKIELVVIRPLSEPDDE